MHAPNMTNIVSETSGSTNAGAPTPSSTNNHGNNDNSQDSSSYKPLVIDNYRPIQEIYDRVVRYGKIVPQKQVSGARALTGSLLSTFIALISVNFFLIYLWYSQLLWICSIVTFVPPKSACWDESSPPFNSLGGKQLSSFLMILFSV